MKPTLFLLAAGMGSRYGGLKQLDGLGPNGETIMDYSIYDAIRAGFGKLVFVIRKDFEQDFRDKILSKYESHIPCELVFQSINDLPEGFTCPFVHNSEVESINREREITSAASTTRKWLYLPFRYSERSWKLPSETQQSGRKIPQYENL